MILGLLHFAASESRAVCLALAEHRWLERLLLVPHYGSPRNVRVCMRLLSRVLPVGQPASAMVPPPSSVLASSSEDAADTGAGQPLAPFLLALIGREVCGVGHR